MRALIVEDDISELNEVRGAFTPDDAIETAETLDEAIKSLKQTWPDLIVSDAMFPASRTDPNIYLHYPHFNVSALLERLQELRPANKRLPAVILISGNVEAAKQTDTIATWLADGRLFELLPKGGYASWPLFREALRHKLRAFRERERWIEAVGDANEAYREMATHGIITGHPAMAKVWDSIKVHALPEAHDVPLYIHGESGSGKELFANAVATLKGVAAAPCNCNQAAEAVAIDLFGVGDGAFTKVNSRPGLIALVGTGVLILDQFCSIELRHQFELLRVIEQKTRDYHPAGEPEQFKRAQCKFVISDTPSPSSAFRSLQDSRAQKRLIEEMYSRLKLAAVRIPPLRERPTDILLLTKSFLARFNLAFRKSVRLDGDVLARFTDGPWAGNVRALHDIVQKLVMHCEETVAWHDVRTIVDPDVLKEEIGGSGGCTLDGTSWQPGNRRPNEKDEDLLKERLRNELPAQAIQALHDLGARLEKRPANDPGRHLFYAALLFVATNSEKKATASDLEKALCIGAAQVNKLCVALDYEIRNDLTVLCDLRDKDARNYLFQM